MTSIGGVTLIRILVVDDFEPWRRILCSRIGKQAGLHVIAEASDGIEGVQKAQQLKPDVILLDVSLPRLNGIAAARQIRSLVPQSKILFLSQESSSDVVQEALSIGSGYIYKIRATEDLLPAMESVICGNEFLSSSLRSCSRIRCSNSGSVPLAGPAVLSG